MPEPLRESICAMRAAVFARLATKTGMYIDRKRLPRIVASSSDAEVWSSIEHANAGLLGYVRRLVVKFRNWRRIVYPSSRLFVIAVLCVVVSVQAAERLTAALS